MTATSSSSYLWPVLQAFFMTIATVLGTGILGLPVKLANAGLGPTIAVLTFVLLMQLSVVIMMNELIQRARYILLQQHQKQFPLPSSSEEEDTKNSNTNGIPSSVSSHTKETEDVSYRSTLSAAATDLSVANDTEESLSSSIVSSLPVVNGTTTHTTSTTTTKTNHGTHSLPPPPSIHAIPPISLHTLALLYLTTKERLWFTVAVLMHFLSILVSYGLAGSYALAQLFQNPSEIIDGTDTLQPLLIAPFILTLTIILITCAVRITSIITILTAVKLGLIIIMIIVVMIVAASSNLVPHDGWSSISQPFLLATVALGGVVNTMPLMATRMPYTVKGQYYFVMAVCVGLTVCYVLNILWAYFVLRIVPQTDTDAIDNGMNPLITLEIAAKAGEISTIPISLIIRQKFPNFAWMSIAVSIFISLSISVSYMVMGAGLKHMLDGLATHWASFVHRRKNSNATDTRTVNMVSSNPSQISSTVEKDRNIPSTEGMEITTTKPTNAESTTGNALSTTDLDDLMNKTPELTQTHMSTAHTLAAAGIISQLANEEAALHMFIDEHGIDDDDEDNDERELIETGDEVELIVAPSIGSSASQKITNNVGSSSSSSSSTHSSTIIPSVPSRGSFPVKGKPPSASPASINRILRTTVVSRQRRSAIKTAQQFVSTANWIMDFTGWLTSAVFRLFIIPLRYIWRRLFLFIHHRIPWVLTEKGLRIVLYILTFGLVLLLAVINPSGFIKALEMFTSLALNLSCGYFIAMMYMTARKLESGGNPLLLTENSAPPSFPSVSMWSTFLFTHLQNTFGSSSTLLFRINSNLVAYYLPLFAAGSFGFAIIYDIIDVATHLLGWKANLGMIIGLVHFFWDTKYAKEILSTVIIIRYNLWKASSQPLGVSSSSFRVSDNVNSSSNGSVEGGGTGLPHENNDLLSPSSIPVKRNPKDEEEAIRLMSSSSINERTPRRLNSNSNNSITVTSPPSVLLPVLQPDPFLRIVVWANVALYECMVVWQWDNCRSDEEENDPTSVKVIYATFILSLVLNELAILLATSAAILDTFAIRTRNKAEAVSSSLFWGLLPHQLALYYHKIPIILSYGATMTTMAGATVLSSLGCGASAFAWWSLFVQMASTAASYLSSLAHEYEDQDQEEENERREEEINSENINNIGAV